MKIQPIDSLTPEEPPAVRFEPVKPVAVKSRLKYLFDLHFLRNFVASEKVVTGAGAVPIGEPHLSKDSGKGTASHEYEPSSVCLDKMVQNFMEDSNEKPSSDAVRCSRNRCNCFTGNRSDNSDDEFDCFGDSSSKFVSSSEAVEILKSLVPCASVSERNLLADTAKIVDKNKICKRKDDFCRNIVIEGLLSLGYNASICKSSWEKSPSHPAGEYEYIDVIISGERLIIDIDFRSEFEIARSTKAYRSLLQTLPYIFVGKADRLQKIISVVSDAAKQSLKKKGMHIPPWRKAEYVKAKWLSPHTRATTPEKEDDKPLNAELVPSQEDDNELGESVFALSPEDGSVLGWKPPEIKPKSFQIGAKMVTGLASVIEP